MLTALTSSSAWLPNSPTEWKVHGAHHNDVVIDDEHKLIFVDNVKAASTTVRQLIMKTLGGITWQEGCEDKYAWCCRSPRPAPRTTTLCLGKEHADYLVFGVARHPVDKFESGVRQAWAQAPQLAQLTADELLEKQLASEDSNELGALSSDDV